MPRFPETAGCSGTDNIRLTVPTGRLIAGGVHTFKIDTWHIVHSLIKLSDSDSDTEVFALYIYLKRKKKRMQGMNTGFMRQFYGLLFYGFLWISDF